MQSVARTYFQTQVTTTTQGDLLIMLFDGALHFLTQAREKIEAKDYAQKGILISKALDILSELQTTLDTDRGGRMAERLKSLYMYCSTRLLWANMKMDLGALDETVHILTGLRDAFSEANSRVETRSVEATSSQSLAPRVVLHDTVPLSGSSRSGLGAAAYARVSQCFAKPAAPEPAPQPAPTPSVETPPDAAIASPDPAREQPTAEHPETIEPAAPPLPTDDAPHPRTSLRRVMAAYAPARRP